MNPQLTQSEITNHNQSQLDYFGKQVKKTMIPVDSYYVNRHVDKLIEVSGIQPNHNVLEVGCGMGKFTIPLLKKGYQITGLDLSPFLLEKFKEYNQNNYPIELLCSDILDMPEKYNEQFDHVIGFFTLHHFLDLEAYYQAMSRVLKPSGKISFVEPNAYNPLYYIQITFSPNMTWKGDKGVINMTYKRFRRAADFAGLTQVKLSKYGFFPPFVSNKKVGQRTEKLLEDIKVFQGVSAFQVVSVTKP
ncbi:methyltransferase type 11 [marine bacterium AO1-C]|nr:methyltransferase type 11 [marine bacterium AO1-C]